MADEIAVISNGRIVERGATQQIIHDPRHEETKKLFASAKATEGNMLLFKGASA
jgi:peptide/nickel transport system ATP-binding protein